jgi:hypothetical protein
MTASDRILLLPRNHSDVAHLPGPLIACDFHALDGTANVHAHGRSVPWGSELGRVVNIDHHADEPRFQRAVSSGTLALAYVAAHGTVGAEATVCVNHTDCDSVLSAAIVTGLLPATTEFGEAVIAADHTGAANDIADLLQAIGDWRDLDRSLANLDRLLDGRPLEAQAQALLDGRRRDRDAARTLADAARADLEDGVAFVQLAQSIDGELFPALLPEAEVILLAFPGAGEDGVTGEWVIRLRLGTPRRVQSLFDLRPWEFDPGMRGRWNAMANRRSGGTVIGPGAYVEEIRRRLRDGAGWPPDSSLRSE